MNYKSFIFLLVGFVAMLATSCSKDESSTPATGISLDKEALTIAVDSTVLLTATLEPEGATGTIAWSSSVPSVAAVVNGVVTALSEGETTIVASYGEFSATCQVTVFEDSDIQNLAILNGSDYYVFQLDGITRELIADRILEDMSPDNEPGSKNLYIWENTFTPGTSTGTNFFGQAEGWISFVVSDIGWSGAGYSVGADYDGLLDLTNMFENPEDYVFHIGMKSSQPSSSYLFIFGDGTSEAKVCIGSAAYDDGGVMYVPYADFARDGEWHSVEIPVTHLNSLGLFYNKPFKDANVLAWLAGGTSGTTLDFDAAFFYKKAE